MTLFRCSVGKYSARMARAIKYRNGVRTTSLKYLMGEYSKGCPFFPVMLTE